MSNFYAETVHCYARVGEVFEIYSRRCLWPLVSCECDQSRNRISTLFILSLSVPDADLEQSGKNIGHAF